MSCSYSIPVIHHDLRQEETFIQITFALDVLNSCAKDTFYRIEKRINENKSKLEALKNRSIVVESKIGQLSGSNKSTKVFSSAKYPVASEYESYLDLYNENWHDKNFHFSQRITSKHQPFESKNLVEKLQFYHVKLGKFPGKNLEVTPEEGLGCLPFDLGSVTSLLLFNTSENPYQRYVQLDPLGAISRTRQALLEEQTAPEAPPLSISQRDQLERPVVDSYFYCPGLGDVPLIDVPLDLPDLPGVADDLRYSVDMGPVIAPSVSTTPSFPDLPVVSESPSNPTETKSLHASSGIGSHHIPSASLMHSSVPLLENRLAPATAPDRAPPPPPSTSTPTPMPTLARAIDTIPPPPPPPPPPPRPPTPPPPPPPPPLPLQLNSPNLPLLPPVSTSQSSVSQEPVLSSAIFDRSSQAPKQMEEDVRANLMEAIRQAGGSGKANLRSAKGMKIETKKRKQEESSSSTDLMADLHAKLALRRKGISGANKSEGSVDNAMQRVSAMIPPPQFSESVACLEEDGNEGMDDDWD